MKKPKFKYVPQRFENDCAICCLAMITGHRYEQVADAFSDKTLARGLTLDHSVSYLIGAGLAVATLDIESWISLSTMNTHVLKPFADAHLVSAKQLLDVPCAHGVYMSNTGKLVDPDSSQPNPTTAKILGIFKVQYVIGAWYT